MADNNNLTNHDVSPDESEPHFLDHPEVQAAFGQTLLDLFRESDRGAVLVGAALVDEHLGRLFEAHFASDLPAGLSRRLLGTGPLSTMSARADIARAMGLIGPIVYDAIHVLRRIRNDVAHTSNSFRLENHHRSIAIISGLGGGLSEFTEHQAADITVELFISRLEQMTADATNAGAEKLFEGRREIAECIQRRPEIKRLLHEQADRFRLGLGVAFICGFLVACRTKLMEPKTESSESEA